MYLLGWLCLLYTRVLFVGPYCYYFNLWFAFSWFPPLTGACPRVLLTPVKINIMKCHGQIQSFPKDDGPLCRLCQAVCSQPCKPSTPRCDRQPCLQVLPGGDPRQATSSAGRGARPLQQGPGQREWGQGKASKWKPTRPRGRRGQFSYKVCNKLSHNSRGTTLCLNLYASYQPHCIHKNIWSDSWAILSATERAEAGGSEQRTGLQLHFSSSITPSGYGGSTLCRLTAVSTREDFSEADPVLTTPAFKCRRWASTIMWFAKNILQHFDFGFLVAF